MKKRILSVLFLAVVGCHSSSSGPTSLNGNSFTIVPPDSSTFTYAYSGNSPVVQLTERVTIVDVTASSFIADRVSDTVDSFSTTENDTYSILPDGDLTLQPDTLPLPLSSHVSNFETDAIPVKVNGAMGTATSSSRAVYAGQETVTVSEESFPCSKIIRTDSFAFVFPSNDTLNGQTWEVITYWYSSQLGYFVKEQEESGEDGTPVLGMWTRSLTSYKLGK